MIVTLKLNEEHLELIRNFRFDIASSREIKIDTINPYGGGFLLEDIAIILGIYDKHIKGTECDFDGAKFPPDVVKHMLELHYYIQDNMYNILNLVHQFATEGIKPGTYKAVYREQIWKKIN